MSRTIDERVLQMEFDNSKFEKNAQESIATLQQLNQSCQMSGATKGFDGLQQAIDNINSHFTIMGRVAERVMDRIVDKIESVATSVTRTAKSLSIDQISEGFSKYTDITSSTNTIIGALGDTDKEIISKQGISEIDYVTEQLKRMNQYTDETSYNLVDMTGNVGKFMSAGIDLQTAVSAMEGIGNWAARSGANVNEASRAMYNLSQAMGVGYVQLMDWKSIENANMATKEFKEQVIATAKEMGTLTNEIESGYEGGVTYKNFNNTLSDKWFTSEVLTKVLDDYNTFYNQLLKIQESEEGASMSITDIVGELQDNTELGAKWIAEYGIELDSLSAKSFLAAQEYKSFSDVISATQDAVSTSWMNIFQDVFGNLEESKDLWSRVGDDFASIFVDPVSDLQGVFDSWKDMGGRDVLLEAFDNLREAVDSIVTPIKEAFADIFGEFSSSGGAAKASSGLLQFTYNLRDFTKSMILSDDAGQGLRSVLREVFRVIDIGLSTLKDLVKIGGNVVKFFADVIEGVFGFINGLQTGEGYLDSFNKCGDSMSNIIESISSAFEHLIKKLKDIPLLGTIVSWGEKIVGFIGGTLKSWLDWLLDKFNELTGIKLEFKIPSAKKIVATLSSIGTALKTLWDVFSSNFDASTPLKFLESIWNGLVGVYGEITKFLDKKYTDFMSKDGTLQQFFKWMGNVKDTSTAGLQKTADGIKQFGENVKTFFSGVNWKGLAEAGIIAAFAFLYTKLKKIIDKVLGLGKDLQTTLKDTITSPIQSFSTAMNAAATDMKADALVKVAEAVGILAVSLTLIARLDADALARCTVALLALMYGLAKVMDSKSTRELSKSVKQLASIKDVLASFADGVVSALKGIAIGALVISFSAAMITLTIALNMLAKVEWDTIGKAGAIFAGLVGGIAVLAGVLSAFTGSATFGSLAGIAAIMLTIGPALIVLAKGVKAFDDIQDTTKAQNAIRAVLAALVGLMTVGAATTWFTGASGLKGVSSTLMTLAAAILLLGTFSTAASRGVSSITSAVGSFCAAIVTITAAALVIKKLKLNTTIDSITKSLEGLVKIASSLAVFNLSIAALTAAFSLFPDGIVKVAKSITTNGKLIVSAIVEMLALAMAAVLAYKAKWATGLVTLVVAVVEAVKDQSDQIIEPVMEILGDVLDAVVRFFDAAVEYVVPGIVNIVNSIANAIRNNTSPILNAISNLWDAAVGLVAEGISKFTGLDLDFTTGLVDFAGKAGVVVAGISKISKALSGLSGSTSGSTSKGWLANMMTSITSTPANLVNNVKAVKSIFDKFGDGLSKAGTTLVNFGSSLGTTGITGAFGKVVSSGGAVLTFMSKYWTQILAVTAAIAGLIAISNKQSKAWKDGYEERYGMSKAYKEAAEAADEYTKSMAEEHKQYATNVTDTESKWNAYQELGKQYDDLDDKSSAAAQTIKDELGEALSIDSTQIQELIDKYGSLEEGIRNYTAIVEAQDLKDTLKENIDTEKEKIKDSLEESEKAYDNYSEALQKYKDAAQEYKEYLQGEGKSDWIDEYMDANNASLEQAEKAWDALEGWYKEKAESTHNAVKETWDTLQQYVDETSYLHNLEDQYDKLNELLNNAINDGSTANREALQSYMDLINDASAEFVTAGEATATELTDQVQEQKDILEKALVLNKSGVIPDDFVDDDIANLKAAYQQLGESGKSALQEAINEATSEGNTDLATALQGILDSFDTGSIDTSSVEVAGQTIGSDAWSGILTGLSTGDTNVSEAIAQLEQQLGGSLTSLFGEDGALNIKSILEGVSGGSIDISSLFSGITIDQETVNTNIATPVQTAVSTAVDTAINNTTIPEESISNLSATISTAYQTASDQAVVDGVDPEKSRAFFEGIGAQYTDMTASGMTADTTSMSTAGTTTGEAAKSGLEDVDTTSSGYYFLQGFANGLSSLSGAIGRRCYTIAQSFVAKFNAGLQEASPSKATKKSGKFFLQGFDIGIKSAKNKTIKNVENSASDIIDAFSGSLDYINALVNDSLDTNPTITPVLDLSQVQNGSAQLASMLGTASYTYRSATAASVGFTSPAQAQTDAINQSMSSAMSDLIAAQQAESDPTYSFSIPLSINGRQIAKATRQYTKSELDALDTINNRKGGIK